MTSKMRRAVAVTVAIGAIFAASTAAGASTGLRAGSTTIGTSGRLTFNNLIVCDVLLLLTLSVNPIPKSTGTQFGAISGTFRNCTGGASGGGAVLGPAPMFYTTWSGTLPTAISNIRTFTGTPARPIGFRFDNILLCPANTLFGGLLEPTLDGVNLRVASSRMASVDFNSSEPLTRNTTGSLFCPSELVIRGALTVFLSPGAPTITLV